MPNPGLLSGWSQTRDHINFGIPFSSEIQFLTYTASNMLE